LAKDAAVHAITDVTGFGLLGHALEMARNSKVTLVIRAGDLPLLSQAATLAQQGFVTGASLRNWASYGKDVHLPAHMPEWQRHLLTDPQTSGGLLISCAPERAGAVVQGIVAAGYADARVIGHARSGPPLIMIDS
jgi:selenide,water dikinase